MIKEDFEDNYFWIELIRPDGKRVQVKYAKAREKFDDDYAVVRAFYPHDGWGNYTFYGIVDKKFRTVIPFKMFVISVFCSQIHVDFLKSSANIGAFFCILTNCHVFLSQFNTSPSMLNGC